MNKLLKQVQDWRTQKPQAAIGLLLFLASLFVYLINDQLLSSNDNIPHSLLALNWLENHTLHFDHFRGSYLYRGNETPYYFAEAPNGHLTSTYPIGTAIVTFPIYCIFFLCLKIAGFLQTLISGSPVHLLDLTSQSFEMQRRAFEKLAASIATSLSVVIFYYSIRLRFKLPASLIATFVYAFATATWVLNSQGLRQHTIANLLVLSIILGLLKADQVKGKPRKIVLLAIGILCGLLPGVRLPCAIYSVGAIVYAIYRYRKEAIFLLLGLSSAFLQFSWQWYYFGFNNPMGGYSKLMEGGAGSYKFTIDYFNEAFWGLLISPNEGFIIFSPIVLFAIPGLYWAWKGRSRQTEQLLIILTVAAFILFIQYCFFAPWTGGSDSFGSRYMTDTLPVVCWLITYAIAHFLQNLAHYQKIITISLATLFLTFLFWSTAVQAIGAFSYTDWGEIPVPLLNSKTRVWDVQDSQIERHTRNLLIRITDPVSDEAAYHQQFKGVIEQIQQEDGKPIQQPILGRAGRRMIVKAIVRNTGQVKWYGYNTGMMKELAKIRVQFFDSHQKLIRTKANSHLFISGILQPGNVGNAIGILAFPNRPGFYTAKFDLMTAGMDKPNQNAWEVAVEVKPRRT